MEGNNDSNSTIIQLKPSPWKDGAAEVREDRMPVLTILRGEQLGKRFLLNERQLFVGRDLHQAEIVVRDPAVSGLHCRFDQDSERANFTITDMGSSNGTFVNRVPVHSATLNEGDKIFIGEVILRFSFQDALENQYQERISDLINIDDMTGLLVKRSFDPDLARSFELSRKGDKPLSVAMMDMDGLKSLNDQHGHQMGSHCIQIVGKLVREILTEEFSPACRFGGDEFIAYFPNKTLSQALEICERIRSAVEAQEYHDELERSPTISIGVAERVENTRSPEELVRLADDALYRAKEAGRNRVVG